MKKSIRIACGQGFWGDWLEAPVHQVQKGPIDYLMLDYLAEVTMSILAKQQSRDPQAGYAQDFVSLIERILPEIVEKNIKVIANAGGVNPSGCALAVREIIKAAGLSDSLKIAVVSGDNIASRLDELQAAGESLAHLDTKDSFENIRSHVRSANVYLGCESLVEALSQGANIIITGRVADPSLPLAAMRHEFGWAEDDWDKLASGIVAGHILECGAQATGGNFSGDWESVPDLANIGYPIVEVSEDASFVVTKHEGTGGCVSVPTVKEQLVYEIGNPKEYITPDVIADFTSIQLEEIGNDRVRVHSIKGSAKPESYKVSMSFFDGYTASGSLVYTWPDAYKKSQKAGEIIRKRLESIGLSFDEIRTEAIGLSSCHGPPREGQSFDPPEVMFRMAVRSKDKAAVTRFTREVASACFKWTAFCYWLCSWKGKSAGSNCLLAYNSFPGFGQTRIEFLLMSKRVQLIEIAHARSGDKGDNTNIGLIVRKPEYYPILVEQVTAEKVKSHFAEICLGDVLRYELPNLGALNFVLQKSLNGGGTVSLRTDAQGKTYSALLLRMEVEVDKALAPV